MSLFFLTFFAIYGGVHVYFFAKARRALRPGTGAALLLALFLICMTLTPMMVRALERHGLDQGARPAAWGAYLWMGYLFFFFTLALCVDGYRLLVAVASRAGSKAPGMPLPTARAAFFLPLTGAFVISCYAFLEAATIRTEKVTIVTSRLPAELPRLRIVQLSDVHLGLLIREERLERMLAQVKEGSPDLLVVTGDLLDGEVASHPRLAAMFREITPRFGKYAVTGNHEFYVGVRQTEEFARNAGFTLLRGEGTTVDGLFNIAGVDDPAGVRAGLSRNVAEAELLGRLPRDRFTLFLKHRPAVAADARGLFDLQLSGHVHKGQIFPFNMVTHLFYPVRMGLSSIGNGSLLYTSRGTGTWGPPLRFLAPPEVTVIDLVRPS